MRTRQNVLVEYMEAKDMMIALDDKLEHAFKYATEVKDDLIRAQVKLDIAYGDLHAALIMAEEEVKGAGGKNGK